MFADAMMKHLHYIFLFMCLALGMSAILQEEQPALRMLTEASADASVTPAPTGCFISMSTDYFSTIAHRPFFNDAETKDPSICRTDATYIFHPFTGGTECQSFFHSQRYPLFLRVLRLRAETYSDLNRHLTYYQSFFRRHAIGVSLVSLLFIHFSINAITMLDLATLEMMGLTFVIGFFVAFIIKMIAFAADSFDFYSSHQKELLRLRRLRKLRQKVELMIRDIPMEDNGLLDDKREEFSRGVNRELTDYHGYYHGVSTGVSKTNLVDYYYPEDTHMMYLNQQEEMLYQKNKKHSGKSADKTK